LCYGESDLRLHGYTNADYANNLDGHKSTSAYIFLLGGSKIFWCSKKQSIVALSTEEAEYVAASSTTQEAID